MAIVYPYQPTPYHQELFDQHDPIEQGNNWFIYCGAIASMFDQIETYARDQDDGTPGWGILLDADRCPAEALLWLAQFVGVPIPAGISEDQIRTRIKTIGQFQPGSGAALVAAIQEVLTDTKTVYLRERDSTVSSAYDGAYGLTILTFASETVSTDAVIARILSQKPVGILYKYQTVTGATYLSLDSGYADYTGMDANYLTYRGMRSNQPGT